MQNLYGSSGYLSGFPIQKVVSRLNGLMMVLKSCKGHSCVYPWETLHPTGNVQTILDAMHPKYDSFYEKEMPEVFFEECSDGYLIEVEGPQNPAIYGSDNVTQAYAYRRGTDWSDWS